MIRLGTDKETLSKMMTTMKVMIMRIWIREVFK